MFFFVLLSTPFARKSARSNNFFYTFPIHCVVSSHRRSLTTPPIGIFIRVNWPPVNLSSVVQRATHVAAVHVASELNQTMEMKHGDTTARSRSTLERYAAPNGKKNKSMKEREEDAPARAGNVKGKTIICNGKARLTIDRENTSSGEEKPQITKVSSYVMRRDFSAIRVRTMNEESEK